MPENIIGLCSRWDAWKNPSACDVKREAPDRYSSRGSACHANNANDTVAVTEKTQPFTCGSRDGDSGQLGRYRNACAKRVVQFTTMLDGASPNSAQSAVRHRLKD